MMAKDQEKDIVGQKRADKMKKIDIMKDVNHQSNSAICRVTLKLAKCYNMPPWDKDNLATESDLRWTVE